MDEPVPRDLGDARCIVSGDKATPRGGPEHAESERIYMGTQGCPGGAGRSRLLCSPLSGSPEADHGARI